MVYVIFVCSHFLSPIFKTRSRNGRKVSLRDPVFLMGEGLILGRDSESDYTP
jgi:hypothetical protein